MRKRWILALFLAASIVAMGGAYAKYHTRRSLSNEQIIIGRRIEGARERLRRELCAEGELRPGRCGDLKTDEELERLER